MHLLDSNSPKGEYSLYKLPQLCLIYKDHQAKVANADRKVITFITALQLKVKSIVCIIEKALRWTNIN